MDATEQWVFAPFRLDPSNACLWRDDQPIALRPKLLTLLTYLVRHAGQLVTKEVLLEVVWPETAVSDAVLKDGIGRLRRLLGETTRTPQFIATVHRRGYRFVAPVTTVAIGVEQHEAGVPPPCARPAPALSLLAVVPPYMVARESELDQLQQWFVQALQGARQIVFVTGEAGIGKTTFVDAFVAQIATTEPVLIGRGQCIEQYGAGEAYLPLLEAFGQMGRGPDGDHLVALFHQQAPSWLLQLPALVPADADAALQRRGGGASRERMLRELAEAVEALAASRPLVLVLEDLHWSDVSTLDWLAYVAQRRQRARLLVLGTYRPGDALIRAHPVHRVSQELQRHEQGRALSLEYWSQAAVAAYLAQRFAQVAVPTGLRRVLHQRTNGNPLFLVTIVDTLVRQGALRQTAAGWLLPADLDIAVVGVPRLYSSSSSTSWNNSYPTSRPFWKRRVWWAWSLGRPRWLLAYTPPWK